MKQLNFIGILILTVKHSLKQHFFFQKEAKTAPKRPILFCLVYPAEFLAMLRQFRIIAEDFRRLPRILETDEGLARPLPKDARRTLQTLNSTFFGNSKHKKIGQFNKNH